MSTTTDWVCKDRRSELACVAKEAMHACMRVTIDVHHATVPWTHQMPAKGPMALATSLAP